MHGTIKTLGLALSILFCIQQCSLAGDVENPCQKFAEYHGFPESEVVQAQKLVLENIKAVLLSGQLLHYDFYTPDNVVKTFCAYGFAWGGHVYNDQGNNIRDEDTMLMQNANTKSRIDNIVDGVKYLSNDFYPYILYKRLEDPSSMADIRSARYGFDNNFYDSHLNRDLIISVFGEPQNTYDPKANLKPTANPEPASWYGDKVLEYFLDEDGFKIHATFLLRSDGTLMRHNAQVTKNEP